MTAAVKVARVMWAAAVAEERDEEATAVAVLATTEGRVAAMMAGWMEVAEREKAVGMAAEGGVRAEMAARKAAALAVE